MKSKNFFIFYFLLNIQFFQGISLTKNAKKQKVNKKK